MSRRKRVALALGMAAVALAAIALYVAARTMQTGFTIPPEARARLKPGITRAEAEAIIGVPPGDYTTGPVVAVAVKIGAEPQRVAEWRTDDGALFLIFNDDGTLLDTVTVPSAREPFLDRLRRELGL